jgi:hypothetical protein
MSQASQNLLDDERIDEVLKTPDPTQTVVVVQYRTARLPWVLLIGVILIVPLIGCAIYYRITEGLRTQAALVARDMLKQWEEQKRLEADQRGPIRHEPSIAPTSTSVSAVKAQEAAVVAPVPPGEHSGSDTPKVEAIATTTKPVEGAAPGTAGAPSSPPMAADGPAVSPPIPSPRGLDPVADVKAPADPARSPLDDPDPTASDPAEPLFGGTASRTGATAQPSPGATLPGTAPPRVETAPAGVQPGIATTPSTAPPIQPIALPADPPLPSREETERQIRAEADQKKAERAREFEEKQAEDRRLQYDDRVRFHQELQEVVERFGNQAGMAIDQLCQKFDYQADPVSFARARQTWSLSRTLAWRVREIRKLDLPETVILNLLSDDFHAQLRKPKGPRNSNEVRVRAARLLLKCGLPSPEEATRLPARPGRSAAPMNERPGTPAPRPAALPR